MLAVVRSPEARASFLVAAHQAVMALLSTGDQSTPPATAEGAAAHAVAAMHSEVTFYDAIPLLRSMRHAGVRHRLVRKALWGALSAAGGSGGGFTGDKERAAAAVGGLDAWALTQLAAVAAGVDAALLGASLPAAEAAVRRAMAGDVRDDEFPPVSTLLSAPHLQALSLAQRRAGSIDAAEATLAHAKSRHPHYDFESPL